MNRVFVQSVPAIAFGLALGATVAQAQEIADWAGFRTAAATFTFDDGPKSDITVCAPVFDKYGYKATFNLVYNWNPDWSGFQTMANNGHEIASHSNSHGTNMSGEEASSKTNIQGKITQDGGVLTVAYPNCNVPDQSAVNANYIAGRICNGSWQGVSDIMTKDGPADWTKVPALMTGSTGSITTTSAFTEQFQKAINQGGWVMFLTHGFTNASDNGSATYSPTDISAIDGALSWAKENDSKIWITTFRNATMYVKERKASKIAAVSSAAAGTMEFTLTHSIADNISKYNYPLSIRVKNSNSWTTVTATQGGSAIDASIKDGYIYFDAVPNGGNIVLQSTSSGTTPVVSSSSSSVTPATSSSSVATAAPFNGSIAVPGTVEAENYDVNAYSHSNTGNDATGYRTDDAGIVKAGTGYAAGYTTAGDYYEYTIDVKSAGTYKVTVNGATGNSADGSVTLTVGASTLTATVKANGDWDTYTAVEAGEMTLAAGEQTLRLAIGNDNLNVDWIKFEGGSGITAIENAIRLDASFGLVKCQVFDMNGQLVKSMSAMAASAHELWNSVNSGLRNGMYVMRYGEVGKSMQTVRVKK